MELKHLKIKVCGMRDPDNVRELALLNPDYMGFIFYPGSKRYVNDMETATTHRLDDHIKKTGVFVNADLGYIREKIEKYQLDAVQLHGSESADFCAELKNNGIEVIKAFGLSEKFNFEQLNEFEDEVDYFLFDTKTEQHGGSGETFDWRVLEGYTLSKPFFLSGGLSKDNISSIKNIKDSRLYALDLNSKFEIEPGLKDIQKLTSVFNEIRTLFQG